MPRAKKTPQEAQLLHLPPFAIGRETAAAACGVAVSTFELRVAKGDLPKPRQLGGRAVWIPEELRAAIHALPVSELLPPPKSPTAG